MSFNRLNNIGGWLAFAISLVTMMMTMAPTAPFWDCGEFLACMNELEVPHPPGAPFFLILGRVFVSFASDVENIAWWGNFMSVICSAFTVMFIFWTITILARKIMLTKGAQPTKEQTWTILFAGMVGALACNFSDSFWFNAVEAEVYAMSSFFTAIVVWLMFKWDMHADEPHSLRYLVLIAFLMGLSTGAHLLNLLTIPALGMIYYFRKWDFSWLGFFIASGVSVFALLLVQYGIMQQTVEIGWVMEKYFTGVVDANNPSESTGLGWAPGSGLIIWGLFLLGSIGTGIFISQWKKMPHLNTALVSVVMIYIGYSTYAMIPIRSAAQPPINENEPFSVVNFLKYLRREQYGDRPLVNGPAYNSIPDSLAKDELNFVDLPDGVPVLQATTLELADGTKWQTNDMGVVAGFKAPADFKGTSYFADAADGTRIRVNTKTNRAYRVYPKYVRDGYKLEYSYSPSQLVFLPRMHSMDANHYNTSVWGYKNFVSSLGGNEKNPYDDDAQQGDHIRFFMQYQVSHMYLRYFMWNFVGRAGDEQDLGWESGLGVFNSSGMPESMANQQGRNHYFFLPLLLGLFGMVWHFSVKTKDASSILALFFFTGFAIIIYLNQTPLQPRERDYSYVGSFQTFCLWIGLGVVGLVEMLRQMLKNNTAYIVGGATLVLVPGIMGYQGWDDHSRALNYVATDSAKNLLESCQKNAIIFTNGDNDTFPLWYAQEVEGIRTDVRIINLSLLNTDWYIHQLQYPMNEAPPVEVTLDQFYYAGEKNQQVSPGDPELKKMMGWTFGEEVVLKVDSATVVKNGTVRPELAAFIPKNGEMRFMPSFRGGQNNPYLLKQDLLIIDILRANAANGWERPIYFASTIPGNAFIGLDDLNYLQSEGLCYRIVPVKLDEQEMNKNSEGRFLSSLDKERTYDLIMNKFAYRELNNPKVYVDDHTRATILGNLRQNIYRAAMEYVREYDFLEQQNGTWAKQITLDSISGKTAEVEALRQKIARNLPVIEADRKKAKELLDVVDKRVPMTIIPADAYLVFMMGSGYAELGEKEIAMRYLDQFNTEVTQTIEYQGFDQSDGNHVRWLRAFNGSIDVLAQLQEYNKAAAAADWLYGITQDPKMGQKAKYLRDLANKGGAPAPVPLAR